MVEVGVRWWPLKADGTRPGAPPAVCRGAEILSALVCPRPPPATLPTYSQPPTRPEPPSPILPTLPCATSAAPQTRNTQQCTPPPQSDEFYRLLDRLRAYTAQNHRDHWAQCTTCGKWRIVDFQAAQRIDDNTEWHCAMLRCERACRDWCKKGGGGGEAHTQQRQERMLAQAQRFQMPACFSREPTSLPLCAVQAALHQLPNAAVQERAGWGPLRCGGHRLGGVGCRGGPGGQGGRGGVSRG
jgi:hypothetical protein